MQRIVSLGGIILILGLWSDWEFWLGHDGPENFSQGKAMMERVYAPYRLTFYCRCPYEGNRPDLGACGYWSRGDRKRARRIEWDHVVPASRLGRDLPCWRKGGRRNCRKVSEKFRRREGNPYNLVPSVGEINGDRSNYPFAEMDRFAKDRVERMKGPYGRCPMQIFRLFTDDGRIWLTDPPEWVRGDIARIYERIAERYDLDLDPWEQRLFARWKKADPPDGWEKERIRRIEAAMDSLGQ